MLPPTWHGGKGSKDDLLRRKRDCSLREGRRARPDGDAQSRRCRRRVVPAVPAGHPRRRVRHRGNRWAAERAYHRCHGRHGRPPVLPCAARQGIPRCRDARAIRGHRRPDARLSYMPYPRARRASRGRSSAACARRRHLRSEPLDEPALLGQEPLYLRRVLRRGGRGRVLRWARIPSTASRSGLAANWMHVARSSLQMPASSAGPAPLSVRSSASRSAAPTISTSPIACAAASARRRVPCR